jgi:hypothetical protein
MSILFAQVQIFAIEGKFSASRWAGFGCKGQKFLKIRAEEF